MNPLNSQNNDVYDLIIIGAGVNGAGVARDAAYRGLNTLLLDKGDFCCGATSWSTRLAHGGLRYLEYFEFALVRESLREREILLKVAPHLVRPLPMTIPIYRDRSRPYFKIAAGMRLYDLLSFDKTLPSHRMFTRSVFRQIFRAVDPDNLAGGAQYYDAQVAYAERLALENILDAESQGATVRNYTEVTGLNREGDRISSLTCRDLESSDTYDIPLSPHALIVNTSGAWVDEVLRRAERNHQPDPIGSEPMVGPTKGSHIVVPPFPGAPENTAFYVEAKSDGRPFFIVPWLGMILIGTTDLRFKGNIESIKADNDEIDYLIAETNAIIPSAQLTRSTVAFTYSGVRPLPYAEGKKPGSVTRSHLLFDHRGDGANNLLSLIGGKITTFRQVGIDVIHEVYQRRQQKPPTDEFSRTQLPGAILLDDARISDWAQIYGDRISSETLHYLVSIYGARTTQLLTLVEQHPDLAQPVLEQLPLIGAQVVFSVTHEYAKSLVDILLRRTMIAIYSNYGLPLLPEVARILKAHCHWSDAKCDRQIQDYFRYMLTHCIPDYEAASYELKQNLVLKESRR
jgi:glycerol-3-phosphate dehydrogenase